jgi:hypothetical protein
MQKAHIQKAPLKHAPLKRTPVSKKKSPFALLSDDISRFQVRVVVIYRQQETDSCAMNLQSFSSGEVSNLQIILPFKCLVFAANGSGA